MDKLERSIRKNLAPYGPAIRAGHYGVQHYTVGDMPKRGFIKRVSCDYSDGVVTDIRIYTVGAAMTPHDYYRESYVETEDISTESYAEVGMIPYYIPTMDVLHRNLRQEAMEADGIENACCNTCNYAEGPVCLAADETINDFDSQRLCCRCEQLYDVAYMPGEKQAWKSKRYIIKNEELLQDPFRLYTVLAKYDAEIAAAMEAGFVPEAEDISPIED